MFDFLVEESLGGMPTSCVFKYLLDSYFFPLCIGVKRIDCG